MFWLFLLLVPLQLQLMAWNSKNIITIFQSSQEILKNRSQKTICLKGGFVFLYKCINCSITREEVCIWQCKVQMQVRCIQKTAHLQLFLRHYQESQKLWQSHLAVSAGFACQSHKYCCFLGKKKKNQSVFYKIKLFVIPYFIVCVCVSFKIKMITTWR